MTQIPDEHGSAREVQRQFAEAGAALRAKKRRRVPQGSGRVALTAFLTAGLVAGGASATRILFVDGDEIPTDPTGVVAIDRAPADRRLSPATAPDPNGSLPWGARTYVNAAGGQCVVIGRVRNGTLGVLAGRTFKPLPAQAPGACQGRDRDEVLLSRRLYLEPNASRTVVFGLVGRDVRQIQLTLRTGETVRLPIASDGVFLRAYRGTRALSGATIAFVDSSSTADRRRLP